MSLFEAFWPRMRLPKTSLACRPDPCASFGIYNIEVWSILELGTDLQSLAFFRKIGPGKKDKRRTSRRPRRFRFCWDRFFEKMPNRLRGLMVTASVSQAEGSGIKFRSVPLKFGIMN